MEGNPVTHFDAARKFITSRVSELTKSTYFQPLSQPLYICGWLLSHSRKRWSKLTDSKPCRHWFPPQDGSLLPPSAESPVAPATEGESPTTQDTIRLIVRGSLGSCSSSSECEFASLFSHTHRDMNCFNTMLCLNKSGLCINGISAWKCRCDVKLKDPLLFSL